MASSLLSEAPENIQVMKSTLRDQKVAVWSLKVLNSSFKGKNIPFKPK